MLSNTRTGWFACLRGVELALSQQLINTHSLDEENTFMRHLPGSETHSVTADQSESSWLI